MGWPQFFGGSDQARKTDFKIKVAHLFWLTWSGVRKLDFYTLNNSNNNAYTVHAVITETKEMVADLPSTAGMLMVT